MQVMAALKCFVIMPFQPRFDPVFDIIRTASAAALPGEELQCGWLKDVHAAGRITDDIIDELQDSTFCIADVTGSNPNVMWETGYAMALGKPTILLGQNVEELPFDLKVHRVIPYEPSHLQDLADKLKLAIQQTLARYELKSVPAPQCGPSCPRVIVVTGSAHTDPVRAEHAAQRLLAPYLDRETTWLCGSNGVTDDAALRYLVARKQHAVAVGYSRFDASAEVRRLVEAGKVRFVDPSLESVPAGLAGPSRRDVLFCAKADLVILLWDGKSKGTQRLIEYFQANARNTLVGFM